MPDIQKSNAQFRYKSANKLSSIERDALNSDRQQLPDPNLINGDLRLANQNLSVAKNEQLPGGRRPLTARGVVNDVYSTQD